MDAIESRVREAVRAYAPAPTLVLTPDGNTARWLERRLLDQGPLVGLVASDLGSFASGICNGLHGPGLEEDDLLILVREVLVGGEAGETSLFKKIGDHRAYQAVTLGTFLELWRGEDAGTPLTEIKNLTPRDKVLLAAYGRFRAIVDRTHPGQWHPGSAPYLALKHLPKVSWLRTCQARFALGFASEVRWQQKLLEALGAELLPLTAHRELAETVEWRSAGPEVEVAQIARFLRLARNAATVLVPAEDVGRYARRLRQHDLPVRAWVPRPAGSTGVPRLVRALLDARSKRPTRSTLSLLLFGRQLRPFEGKDLPYGTIRELWKRMRRGSGSIQEWRAWVEKAHGLGVLTLEERPDIAPERLEHRRKELARASKALVGTLDRLVAVRTAADLKKLLEDWQAGNATRGERGSAAARASLESLRTKLVELGDQPLDEVRDILVASVEEVAPGEWLDDVSEGRIPAVEVMPHGTALPPREDLVVICGLERYPAPPAPGPMLSDEAEAQVGLEGSRARYKAACWLLDRQASAARVVLSWRDRDGQGAACPAGPWILRRKCKETIAFGPGHLSPRGWSRQPSRRDAEVRRQRSESLLGARVRAVGSHEAEAFGAYSGLLGVRIVLSGTTSVSALQSYARLPYRYFVERILGYREPEEIGDEPSRMEQGNVIHAALEAQVKAILDERGGQPVPWAEIHPRIAAGIEAYIGEQLTRGFNGLLAQEVLEGDRKRWTEAVADWREKLSARHEDKKKKNFELPLPAVARVEHELGSRNEPVVVPLENGLELHLVGKIDVVEVDPYTGKTAIVDYKTGGDSKALSKEIQQGHHLQLPLYAKALLQSGWRMPGHPEMDLQLVAGRLEFLRKNSVSAVPLDAKQMIRPEDGSALGPIEAALHFAGAYLKAISEGRFPARRRVPGGRQGPDRWAELLRCLPEEDPREDGLPKGLTEVVPVKEPKEKKLKPEKKAQEAPSEGAAEPDGAAGKTTKKRPAKPRRKAGSSSEGVEG